MSAKHYDYQKLYRGFCTGLQENPDLKFSHYCDQADVPWRRLYDWMSRRKISLKKLYAGVRMESAVDMNADKHSQDKGSAFIPVRVEKMQRSAVAKPGSMAVCVTLPSGARIELSGCTAGEVATILRGPLMGMMDV